MLLKTYPSLFALQVPRFQVLRWSLLHGQTSVNRKFLSTVSSSTCSLGFPPVVYMILILPSSLSQQALNNMVIMPILVLYIWSSMNLCTGMLSEWVSLGIQILARSSTNFVICYITLIVSEYVSKIAQNTGR